MIRRMIGRRERAVDECSEIDLPLMTAALIKSRCESLWHGHEGQSIKQQSEKHLTRPLR